MINSGLCYKITKNNTRVAVLNINFMLKKKHLLVTAGALNNSFSNLCLDLLLFNKFKHSFFGI